MSTLLREHGTEFMRLKPANIAQAAEADLKLRERKSQGKAEPKERYSFFRRHVWRARDHIHLIALAYFENIRTDKESTLLIYNDRELLRQTLIHLLQGGDADTMHHANEV